MQPFVIEVDGRLAGQMHLFGIGWGALRGGAAGYWVARHLAGHGIAPLALAGLVDHAIYGLGLHRVEVNIHPENVASLRVVDKLGFRDEGTRAGYLHIDGAWHSHAAPVRPHGRGSRRHLARQAVAPRAAPPGAAIPAP